jgi:hypothetical protein
VNKIADAIKARQGGKSIEDVVGTIFAPKQQVPPAGAAPSVEQLSPVPGAAAPAEGQPMQQGAPEVAPQGPPPDLQTLMSSLSGGGQANATVRTIRKTK